MELITGTVIKRKNSCRLTTDSGEEYNLKFSSPQIKYFIGNRSRIRVRGVIKEKRNIQVLEAESFAYVATSEEIRTLAEETGITIDRGKLEEEITASSSTSIDELINKIENGKYEPKYPELAKQLLAISKKIKQNREILNLYQYFSDIGMIDIPLLFSIYDAFERRAKLANTSVTELIKENPYLLLQVEGFPVETALEIAETKGKFSKEQKEIFSCMAEILQSISKFQQKGHNYTFLNIIYAEMSKKYDSNTIKKALENLQYGTYGKKFGRTVLIKDEAVKVTAQEYFKNPPANPAALYLPGTFFAEKNGAETLGKLISKNFTSPFDFKKVSEIINNKYPHLSEAQKVFIKTALGGRITVLTGGAGTGKTTALHAIADIVYELTGKMPVIMAPTAVAAFRAAEGTIVGQNESKYGTIHRLLKIITRETDEYVDTGEEKEGIIIDADFVIVDESSMLTPLNFQKLLNCITNKTQMVFAGDPNQLPPIKNAGVFPTLIALGRDKTVPNIHLIEFTQQFRSSLSLLRNAYRVLEGEAIQFDGEELKFIKAEKDRTIKEKVWETIIQLMEEQGIKEFNPYEILVLTPRIAQVLPTDFSRLYDLETLAFAILGSVYFVVIKNLIWENKDDITDELETVKVFLDKGIDMDGTFTPFIVPEIPVESQEPQFASRRERTKYQLLKAGEKLFGEKGFEQTQLTEITSEAGVGLGTFYLYFESKTELLAEIVRYVNHTLRKASRIYQDGLTDRRAIENVGFQAFYYLFKNMGPAYA